MNTPHTLFSLALQFLQVAVAKIQTPNQNQAYSWNENNVEAEPPSPENS